LRNENDRWRYVGHADFPGIARAQQAILIGKYGTEGNGARTVVELTRYYLNFALRGIGASVRQHQLHRWQLTALFGHGGADHPVIKRDKIILAPEERSKHIRYFRQYGLRFGCCRPFQAAHFDRHAADVTRYRSQDDGVTDAE